MIDLSGVTAAVEALEAAVERLHAEALAASVAEVSADVTQLEYMTSSCFKCLVTWISTITDLDEAQRYTLRFRSSPEHLWQRRSLHVLKTFATDLVFVETSA